MESDGSQPVNLMFSGDLVILHGAQELIFWARSHSIRKGSFLHIVTYLKFMLGSNQWVFNSEVIM